MLATQEPVDYFESGNGGTWFLALADGFRRLMEYCLETEGLLLVPEEK